MRLRLVKDEMEVQRIGPLAHLIKPQPDPDPSRTNRIATILKAFENGGKSVKMAEGIAPQAQKDYEQSPSLEFAGIQSISFISSQDVSNNGIVRHSGKVSRVLYYRLHTDRASRFVLIYLTANDLVTDQDVVDI